MPPPNLADRWTNGRVTDDPLGEHIHPHNTASISTPLTHIHILEHLTTHSVSYTPKTTLTPKIPTQPQPLTTLVHYTEPLHPAGTLLHQSNPHPLRNLSPPSTQPSTTAKAALHSIHQP